MSVDDKVRKLIQVLKDSDIDQLEVTSFWGAQKIKLTKNSQNDNISKVKTTSKTKTDSHIHDKDIITTAIAEPEENKTEINNTEEVISKEITVEKVEETSNDDFFKQKAPLVGTFYRSSKPDEPSFVEIGDKVVKGQILCIIEAMKIFNEIESEVSGRVKNILIKDSTPIEYDQNLNDYNK